MSLAENLRPDGHFPFSGDRLARSPLRASGQPRPGISEHRTEELVKVSSSFGDRKVCILGLGYVGLTLAAVMADVGFSITGVEIRLEILDLLRGGKASFHEPGLEKILHQGAEDGLLSWHQYI